MNRFPMTHVRIVSADGHTVAQYDANTTHHVAVASMDPFQEVTSRPDVKAHLEYINDTLGVSVYVMDGRVLIDDTVPWLSLGDLADALHKLARLISHARGEIA